MKKKITPISSTLTNMKTSKLDDVEYISSSGKPGGIIAHGKLYESEEALKKAEEERKAAAEKKAAEEKKPDVPATKDLVPTADFNTYIKTVQSVPEETVAEVVHDAEGIVTWIKYTASGFVISEQTVPEIQGVIQYVKPHFAKWDGDQVEKADRLDDLTEEEAEGFERRCDIHVMTVAGLLVGISMPKTSYYQRFAPYLKLLDEKGLNPADVLTEINVGQKKNAFGVYNILNFRVVKLLKEAVSDDDIPF